MDIKEEDIKYFLEKRIRIVLENSYTYVGKIVSYGKDYITFRDKYEKVHLLPFSNIIHWEEVE